MWPDVLSRVYQQRRATWTFVSEHAQVIDYDGKRLRLAISTDGLLQTFRRGPHAELVRQALIDVLGVDAQVEGIRLEGNGPAAAPGRSTPTERPEPDRPEVTPTDRAAAAARSWDEPAPEPPEPPEDPEGAPPPPEPARATSRQAAQRAAAARPETAPEPPDEPAPDDPDLDGAALMGQSAVEQLLGGRVIDDA